MQEVLVRLATLLSENQVTWALGASMMLAFHGLVEKPNDIDLLAAPQDMERADALLRTIGEKRPPNPQAAYATRYFYEYLVEGVEVDVMSGFSIRYPGGLYEYTLRPADFLWKELGGTRIPLCPLEDWYVLYLLMPGREAKAALIRTHLQRKGFDARILRERMGEGLPGGVRRKVVALLKE